MSSDAVLFRLPAGRSAPRVMVRLARLARREGPLLLTFSVFAAAVTVLIPLVQLNQDGWLTLVGGRQLLDHGLFAPDSLTALTRGDEWVDQQWLAQIAFYGLASAGGVKLAFLVHAALVVGAFGLAMGVARRRGADVLAVAWIGALLMVLVLWGSAMRSQNLAYPLFVGVLALLVLDRGAPSRRVFWTVPLLVVWANLHGSVLLGAALVCIYAVMSGGPGWRRVALFAGAVAAVFATPYALSVPHYYRSVLANPDMRVVAEWRPVTDFAQAWLFLAVLAIAAVLVVRARRRLQPFEIVVLAVTAAGAFQALRNVVWFAYAAVLILPLAATSVRSPTRAPLALFAPLALAVLAVVAGTALTRSDRWYQQEWSPAAAQRVAAEVRLHPATTIWATDRFADWLLWKQPALAGHVAYDARLELLDHSDFRAISRFGAANRAGWSAVVAPYDVVVLETKADRKQVAALHADAGRPTLYADRFVTVLGRPAAGS